MSVILLLTGGKLLRKVVFVDRSRDLRSRGHQEGFALAAGGRGGQEPVRNEDQRLHQHLSDGRSWCGQVAAPVLH